MDYFQDLASFCSKEVPIFTNFAFCFFFISINNNYGQEKAPCETRYCSFSFCRSCAVKLILPLLFFGNLLNWMRWLRWLCWLR